jgi:hypothetical protein
MDKLGNVPSGGNGAAVSVGAPAAAAVEMAAPAEEKVSTNAPFELPFQKGSTSVFLFLGNLANLGGSKIGL